MILQALNGYYDRVSQHEDSKIAPPGYSYQPISFSVLLSKDGSVIDIDDLRTVAGNRPQPMALLVPQPPKRSGTKPPPCFLWDKTGYVFGVERSDDDKSKAVENPEYREAFRAKHLKVLVGVADAGLLALLRFLRNWDPAQYSSLRYSDDLLDSNVVFRLDGEHSYLHDCTEARAVWEKEMHSDEAETGQCLVLGRLLPIARLHPRISGITVGGQRADTLVGFNEPAFESYGKKQGANAPISGHAAFVYTTALNDLLRKDGRQKVLIGDATTVYWAEAADQKEARAAESVFGWLAEPPSLEGLDQSEVKAITDVLTLVKDGKPLEEPELHLKVRTKFYILGLAPNAARLSVRFWEATTLGAIGRAFHQHWQDLLVEPRPWRHPPAIWRLLSRTAPARRNQNGAVKYDAKQIPSNLGGEMMRAILSGQPYPKTILANAVMRFRSDHVLDGLRVALVKAALVREMRARDPDVPKEAYVSLNPEDLDAAYRLGRLFALLEKAQLASIDGINATICDRYYGAAAATPARVFGFLIKNSKSHLAALRRGRGAKWVKKPAATGGWLDREIGAIFEPLKGSFPASLTLEEQGRFSIGYYHQKYAKHADIPDDLNTKESQADRDDSANDNGN
jgi:CRISPR-associated protein Csd1